MGLRQTDYPGLGEYEVITDTSIVDEDGKTHQLSPNNRLRIVAVHWTEADRTEYCYVNITNCDGDLLKKGVKISRESLNTCLAS